MSTLPPISGSFVPIKPPKEPLKLDFGLSFKVLPLELINKILRECLIGKERTKFFGCVRQLNKTFKFCTRWKVIDSIPVQMPFNQSHFIRAIRAGQRKSVLKLKDHPTVILDDSMAPFKAAIEAGQPEIFKKLWENKANIKKDVVGQTTTERDLLALAIKKGNLEIAEFLIQNNIPLPENSGLLAIESENLDVLRRFLPSDHACFQSKALYKFLWKAVNQFSLQTKQRNFAVVEYLLSHKN